MASRGFVLFNDAGVVMTAGTGEFPDPMGVTITPPLDPAILARMMLVERPALPPITSADGVWSVTGCPVGTVIEVMDDTGAERMFREEITDPADTGRTFALPEPGDYEISVTPPLPWLPQNLKVTVE